MSMKKLDTTGITNELEGASLHFARAAKGRPTAGGACGRTARQTARKRSAIPQPAAAAPATGSGNGQPLGGVLNQLAGRVVSRPVSFYIPEVINDKIDEAVDYMDKRHGIRVDRSAIVSAILGNPALWEPESLNGLVDQAVGQLTSRLTSRLSSRPVKQPVPTAHKPNPLTEVEMRSVP